ncbi:hypothetical protein [Actinophytocola sediminis]
MRDPIQVNYEPQGDDWKVTVTGRGLTRKGKASGLIAARDRADQIVAKMTPGEEHRTVVHLLNGDALAFTSAYLSARLARPTQMPSELSSAEPAPAKKRTRSPRQPAKATEETAEAEVPAVPLPTQTADEPQKASTS